MSREEKASTHFTVVKLPESLRVAASKSASGKKIRHAPSGRRLLSISYDPALMRTRHMLLSDWGHEVTSVGTRDEAFEQCGTKNFDLVILGHGIPLADKKLMIRRLKDICETPVLSMLTGAEQAPEESDYSFQTGDGPKAFLERVNEILTKPSTGRR